MPIGGICWYLCRVLCSTPGAIGLGRGAGFYDRMLGQLVGSATIVGLAYEFQIVDAVPSQSWDCRMEFVVTEARTIDCGVNLHKASVSGRWGIEKEVF